jgi:hypothetical protein
MRDHAPGKKEDVAIQQLRFGQESAECRIIAIEQEEGTNGLTVLRERARHLERHYSAVTAPSEIIRAVWLHFPNLIDVTLRSLLHAMEWLRAVQPLGLKTIDR